MTRGYRGATTECGRVRSPKNDARHRPDIGEDGVANVVAADFRGAGSAGARRGCRDLGIRRGIPSGIQGRAAASGYR